MIYIQTDGERWLPLLDADRILQKYVREPEALAAAISEMVLASSVGTTATRVVGSTLRLSVLERDGYACLRCGSQDDLEIDHVVPYSLGGPTTIENLQTLCSLCNAAKRQRALDYRPGADAQPDPLSRARERKPSQADTLTIRLSDEERDEWEREAGDVPLSRWFKHIINEHLMQNGREENSRDR